MRLALMYKVSEIASRRLYLFPPVSHMSASTSLDSVGCPNTGAAIRLVGGRIVNK